MGALLVELPDAQFKRIELPEELREAVAACRKITQNGALRRQKQYIGKLMRSVDPAPIQAQLDAFSGASAAETAKLHPGREMARQADRRQRGADAVSEHLPRHRRHASAATHPQCARRGRAQQATESFP